MSADLALLGRQVRHDLVALRRTPITMILTIVFPLLFFVLLAAVIGNETIDSRQGVRIAQFLAPSMASFGVVMATFSFLAVGFAEARSAGVLKRQGGTPLPPWALLGGRVGAALILGLTATILVIGTGAAFYGVQVFGRTLPAVLVTLVLASVSFSAMGLAFALLLPTPQATIAVTNGIVMPIAFVSDTFIVNGTLPAWMSTLGWLFPLKHVVNLMGDALNPYLTGSAFQLDHLAAIAAWGLAGALVAVWALRREQGRSSVRRGQARSAPASDTRPRRTAAPSPVMLLADQAMHSVRVLSRNASATFFAVAFPVLLVALIPTVNGGGDELMGNGQTLGAFFAATMAVYGAAVTAYVNLPTGLAESRDAGVLQRLRGTPLPAWTLLTGRVIGAVCVALITLAGIGVVGGLMYGTPIPAAWPAVLVTVLLATVCFAVVGIAVMTFVRTASSLVGVTLGTLLPLCFISDVFVVGAGYPPVVQGVSWFFPLRHATNALTEATHSIGIGGGFSWVHLGVMAAWTLAGAVVVALRFSWVRLEPRRSQEATTRRRERPA
jgi:ABC-type multidrug transport system permease subunit